MSNSHSIRRRAILMTASVSVGLSAGCGQTHLPDAVDTNLARVGQIRDDANLTGQEKRDQLLELGLSDVDINGLLRATRTANQFGGTAETGLNKVANGQLNTMTPDEVQLYGDLVGEATFSDAQAQDLINLLILNGLATQDALKTFLEENDIDTPAGLNVGDVQATFVDAKPEDFLENLP